jgi:hypothetical protein
MFSAMRAILITGLALFALGLIRPAGGMEIGGRYTGAWSSKASGAGGTLRLNLRNAGGGKWDLEVTFTLNDADVKTTLRSVQVEGTRLEAQYDFEFGGSTLRSTIKGQLTGDRLEGDYKTSAGQDGSQVDEGTWHASSVK